MENIVFANQTELFIIFHDITANYNGSNDVQKGVKHYSAFSVPSLGIYNNKLMITALLFI